MTTTLASRTEAQLLRQLAAELRRHPERRDLSDSVHAVMHGESKDRWTNLVAALGIDLHTAPLNAYDRDELHACDGQRDHPAAYAMRLDIWAARIGSPALVAATLDLLAATAEREYEYPSSWPELGGRAYRGRVPRAVLELADEYFGGAR